MRTMRVLLAIGFILPVLGMNDAGAAEGALKTPKAPHSASKVSHVFRSLAKGIGNRLGLRNKSAKTAARSPQKVLTKEEPRKADLSQGSDQARAGLDELLPMMHAMKPQMEQIGQILERDDGARAVAELDELLPMMATTQTRMARMAQMLGIEPVLTEDKPRKADFFRSSDQARAGDKLDELLSMMHTMKTWMGQMEQMLGMDAVVTKDEPWKASFFRTSDQARAVDKLKELLSMMHTMKTRMEQMMTRME